MRSPLAKKKRFLDGLHATYNRPEFIHPDPLEFLHGYSDPQDREIVGIISSSLAYGRVAQILKSITLIHNTMSLSPRDFLEGSSRASLIRQFSGFKHRFTAGQEITEFLLAIQKVIHVYGSLEKCFLHFYDPADDDVTGALEGFVSRIRHHLVNKKNSLLPCPEKNSACKRLHLFLRWMVRRDSVDPGGWDNIGPSKLIVPWMLTCTG
jgi:uncharacterized protein (TIGR02757 family)